MPHLSKVFERVLYKQIEVSLLQRYFRNRFQRSIINGSYGRWNEVITGGSQDSILGLLHVNMFLNDIFLFILKCQLGNYADDNTLYKLAKKTNAFLKCCFSVIITPLCISHGGNFPLREESVYRQITSTKRLTIF